MIEVGPRIIFRIGEVNITETVIFGWIVSAVILLFAFLATRNMQRIPKGFQLVGEMLVGLVYGMVKDAMGEIGERFAPYMGTLFLFLGLGSMLGMLELRPITADLNCTLPLAILSFVLIHYNSMRVRGFIGYNKHLASPYVWMWPLNLMSECVFPVTLACRIFGNIFAGVIVMSLVYSALEAASHALGSFIPFFQIGLPLPLHFWFDLFEPILQAYIFATLTMVFLANNMDTSEE